MKKKDNTRNMTGGGMNAEKLALLSHYLLNRDENGGLFDDGLLHEDVAELVSDYASCMGLKGEGLQKQLPMSLDNMSASDLFHDFFDVPFPPPTNYQHTFIDLFAGIGGIRIPFDELGYKCVFSSEWDDKACETYFANFGTYPFGDITRIPERLIPRHDVLLAGFPCQAFSIMGKMQGFADTRGTMFFEIERILKYHRTPYILLENVKQLVGHDGGRTFKVILERLSQLGYFVKWKVLTHLTSDFRRSARGL